MANTVGFRGTPLAEGGFGQALGSVSGKSHCKQARVVTSKHMSAGDEST